LRGGTFADIADKITEEGLSPLARGNRTESVMVALDEGSIPACAGEPNGSRLIQTPQGVYPRLRGGTRA